MSELNKNDIQNLAEEHVDWFLKTVRPLLITEFLHGYKHGRSESKENKPGIRNGQGRLCSVPVRL